MDRLRRRHRDARARIGLGAAIGLIVTTAGVYILTSSEVAGASVWSTPTEIPGSTSGDRINAVSCTSAGNCVAVGSDGKPIYVTEANGSWGPITEVENSPGSGDGILDAVDCPSVGNCVAVGETTGLNPGPLVMRESGGSWDTPYVLTGSYEGTGNLTGVSCTSNSICTMVGWDNISTSSQNYADLLVGSLDSDNVQTFTGIADNPEESYGSFDAISCTAESTCTAVGVDGNAEPFVATTSSGGWVMQEISATNGSDDFPGDFVGVSCPSVGNCVAVGRGDFYGTYEPILATESSGVWSYTATEMAVSGGGQLTGVSCPFSYSCTASAWVGSDQPAYLVQTGGAWGSVTQLSGSPGGGGSLLGVSCTSDGGCTAVGNDANSRPMYAVEVGPPTVTLTSPVDGATYAVDEVVPVTVSCSDAAGGPGISYCGPSNGDYTTLPTGSPGTYPFCVYALSADGQRSPAKCINYTVAGYPTATITSPVDGGTYAVDEVVPFTFSCSDAAGGPGISSCLDNGHKSSPDMLYTAAPGNYTAYVEAVSADGASGEATIHYTVSGYPTATITSPANGGTYAVDEVVHTTFSCTDAPGGPGISTCLDTDGSASPATLFTSNPGTYSFDVWATSADGAVGDTSISYTVSGYPTATITSPASGGTYYTNEVVRPTFSCADAPGGPGISSCVDTNGSTSPGTLFTSNPGTYSYYVWAASADGAVANTTTSITYTVVGVPPPTITSPANSGTYYVGEVVPVTISCTDAPSPDAPGIAWCGASNRGPSTLETSSPGSYSFCAQAVSLDGDNSPATCISYKVAALPTATITSPVEGSTYALGETVPTSFSCTDAPGGPGITSCLDGAGSTSPGVLNASTPGTHTYTVTSTSADGGTGTASVSYTIVGNPTATITSPLGGATYVIGQTVPTSFSCTDAPGGPGITSCLDGAGSTSPGVLNTSTPGTHTYTVTATSADGGTGTASVSYTMTGLYITTNSLLPGAVNAQYSAPLAAEGGNPPYTWKLAKGSAKLPKGLKLNKQTGVISGTPKGTARSSTFTVEVLDKKVKVKGHPATQNTATRTLSITIS